MALVGEVEAFCTPERARKAVRKLEKNGRLVVIVAGFGWPAAATVEMRFEEVFSTRGVERFQR